MAAWPTLTDDQLDLTRDTWDLTQTLSDTLGDLGTPQDGFDSYLNDTLTLLSGFGDLSGSLLDDLGLATGIASLIDPTSLDGDAASLPASLATGDSIVADANALLGSVGPPPPAGGGGGGGGGGGTPQPTCADVNFGTVTGFSQSLQKQLTLTNPLSAPITIKSATLSDPTLVNIAHLTPDPTGSTIAPGGTLPITVQMFALPGTYSYQWTLNTDAQGPQPCITVELSALNPQGGGTGGTCGLPGGGGCGPPSGRNP